MEVKGSLTGAAEYVSVKVGRAWGTAKAKYQAIKKSNKDMKLHFLHSIGATVTESGEDMDKWLKSIGLDGGTEFSEEWLKDKVGSFLNRGDKGVITVLPI